MDTHIPEGMQPAVHPHKRMLEDKIDARGAMAVDRDRSLGRANDTATRITVEQGVMSRLRRLIRA